MQFIGALDPSLGETLKGSLQAIFILGIDTKGQCYEVESMGTHMTPEEAMKTIFNFQYKFNRFGIEAVQFQKYFLKTLQDKSKAEQRYIPFVGIQQSKNKLQRIESMEPIVNTGQILFKGGNELADEMADYPNTEFLDVLDSMEMAWRTFQKGKVDFAFA
jgi:predicted phage terminase large subunit-like protein